MEELLCKSQQSLLSVIFFSDMRRTHIMKHFEINLDFFTNIDRASRKISTKNIKNWMLVEEKNDATD